MGLAGRMESKQGSKALRQKCIKELGGAEAGGRSDYTKEGKVPDAQGGYGGQTQTHLETESRISFGNKTHTSTHMLRKHGARWNEIYIFLISQLFESILWRWGKPGWKCLLIHCEMLLLIKILGNSFLQVKRLTEYNDARHLCGLHPLLPTMTEGWLGGYFIPPPLHPHSQLMASLTI